MHPTSYIALILIVSLMYGKKKTVEFELFLFFCFVFCLFLFDVVVFPLFYAVVSLVQSKGVRLVVVGIGPDAQKKKYQQVLHSIGGDNVFYVTDYDELDGTISNITDLICRRYSANKISFRILNSYSKGVLALLISRKVLWEKRQCFKPSRFRLGLHANN